jgi:shikimate dehydrogenase
MTQKLLVLGNPVEHSKSPEFQNAGIRERNLDAIYERQRATESQMSIFAEQCRKGEILGANITLPHKEIAANLADHRTSEVELIGVANTWWHCDGALCADNTDIYGVQASIAALGIEKADKAVLVGAGGAAAGALIAIRHVVSELTICNRTVERAERLAERARTLTSADVQVFGWPEQAPATSGLKEAFASADVIIQATSLPVKRPDVSEPFERLPWSEISGACGLVELCYAEEPTAAMRLAGKAGAASLDGGTMLLHQGLRSFERWFNQKAPAVVMRDALANALQRDRSDIPVELNRKVMSALMNTGGEGR